MDCGPFGSVDKITLGGVMYKINMYILIKMYGIKKVTSPEIAIC